jgi:hypothetical protein
MLMLLCFGEISRGEALVRFQTFALDYRHSSRGHVRLTLETAPSLRTISQFKQRSA